MSDPRPLVVGIGGTTRESSTSERALSIALHAAETAGAATQAFGGAYLARLPLYAPEDPTRSPAEEQLVDAVRHADGLILASPGYHGGVSGMLKNALDLLEDLRDDERPYLTDRAVGCIVNARGWQACGTTLVSLRSIVHALRGWPTPLGVTLNSSQPLFDDDRVREQLRIVGEQVMQLATASERAQITR